MTTGRNLYYVQANSEIRLGEDALKEGNKGKARVCARRACFWAILFWTEVNDINDWGDSAISLLKHVRDSEVLPRNIRDAAGRLTEKVNPDFEVSHNVDPLEDAVKIVEYFLDVNNL